MGDGKEESSVLMPWTQAYSQIVVVVPLSTAVCSGQSRCSSYFRNCGIL